MTQPYPKISEVLKKMIMLHCWFACEVMAAMLLVENNSLSVRLELNLSALSRG